MVVFKDINFLRWNSNAPLGGSVLLFCLVVSLHPRVSAAKSNSLTSCQCAPLSSASADHASTRTLEWSCVMWSPFQDSNAPTLACVSSLSYKFNGGWQGKINNHVLNNQTELECRKGIWWRCWNTIKKMKKVILIWLIKYSFLGEVFWLYLFKMGEVNIQKYMADWGLVNTFFSNLHLFVLHKGTFNVNTFQSPRLPLVDFLSQPIWNEYAGATK